MKASIIFHSVSGRTYDLAEALADGVRSVEGFAAELYRVYDPMTDDEVTHWAPHREKFAHIKEVKWGDMSPLEDIDALIIGGPVIFGQISPMIYDYLLYSAQKQYVGGDLIGKAGAAFCTCASQNGGAEVAIRNMQSTLMHFGLVIVPFPNRIGVKEMREHDFPIGGTPYGASASVGMNQTYREVVEMEKSLARQHGEYIAKVAKALKNSEQLFIK